MRLIIPWGAMADNMGMELSMGMRCMFIYKEERIDKASDFKLEILFMIITK